MRKPRVPRGLPLAPPLHPLAVAGADGAPADEDDEEVDDDDESATNESGSQTTEAAASGIKSNPDNGTVTITAAVVATLAA